MEEIQRQQGLTDPEDLVGHDETPAPIYKDPDEADNPLSKPTKGGLLAVSKWALMFPLYFLAK